MVDWLDFWCGYRRRDSGGIIMRNTILAGLALVASSALAQEVPAFSYQWSLSGKQYAVASQPIDRLGPFTFSFVGGTEVKTSNAPALGLGLSYRFDRERWYGGVGAFALFPQKSQPDLGFGIEFGVKF